MCAAVCVRTLMRTARSFFRLYLDIGYNRGRKRKGKKEIFLVVVVAFSARIVPYLARPLATRWMPLKGNLSRVHRIRQYYQYALSGRTYGQYVIPSQITVSVTSLDALRTDVVRKGLRVRLRPRSSISPRSIPSTRVWARES
jgi:hypothetical protein